MASPSRPPCPPARHSALTPPDLHHVLGLYLRQHAHLLGLPRDFLIAGDCDCALILSDALLDTERAPDSSGIRELKKGFRRTRSDGLVPSEIAEDRLRALRNRYGEFLRFYRCVDFDGVILGALAILGRQPAVLEEYRRKAKFLLIDEYQDINGAQHRLIRHLAGNPQGVSAVGDADQSIYGWRGGRPEFILSFPEGFPGATTRPLTASHRCPGHILEGAVALIRNNRSRHQENSPKSSRLAGQPIQILVSKSENAEADWIARWIKEATSDEQYGSSDISVLAADPAIFDLTFRAVTEQGVAAYRRRRSPLEASPSWRVLSLLRLAFDPHDNLAARVCVTEGPVPGLGPEAARVIRSEARNTGRSVVDVIASPPKSLSRWRRPLGELAQYVQSLEQAVAAEAVPTLIGKIAGDLRLGQDEEAVAYLIGLARQTEATDASGFLSALQERKGLDATGELLGGESDGVQFLTVHLAKGLESKVVFVLGLEAGLFPDPEKDVEEQRRLLYVAMTRAQALLFLCTAKMRKVRGFRFRDPSRFLAEIPSQHVRKLPNT